MGRVRVADVWSDKLGAPLAIIHKRRDPLVPNQVTVHDIVGDVEDKWCVVVDDMIDTGGAIAKAARGAEGERRPRCGGRVYPLFSRAELPSTSPRTSSTRSSSPTPCRFPRKRFDKLTVLSIAPLLAQADSRGLRRRLGHEHV